MDAFYATRLINGQDCEEGSPLPAGRGGENARGHSESLGVDSEAGQETFPHLDLHSARARRNHGVRSFVARSDFEEPPRITKWIS